MNETSKGDVDLQWDDKLGFSLASWKSVLEKRSQKIPPRCWMGFESLIHSFPYNLDRVGQTKRSWPDWSSDHIHPWSYPDRSYQWRMVRQAFWQWEAVPSQRKLYSTRVSPRNADIPCYLVWWWTSSHTYRHHSRYSPMPHLEQGPLLCPLWDNGYVFQYQRFWVLPDEKSSSPWSYQASAGHACQLCVRCYRHLYRHTDSLIISYRIQAAAEQTYASRQPASKPMVPLGISFGDNIRHGWINPERIEWWASGVGRSWC